jgi:hypothetical protein
MQFECKRCKTTDLKDFYPSVPNKCKACQKVKHGGDRKPGSPHNIKCLGLCGRTLSTDFFEVSSNTGLYMDKCNECRHKIYKDTLILETRKKYTERFAKLERWALEQESISNEDWEMLSVISLKLSKRVS